jgi:putative endonuclease
VKSGTSAELFAQEILSLRGYQIITTNFTCRGGELDIIAQQGDILCFIEVKSRSSVRFGLPQEAIRYTKQRRMIIAANRYLQGLKQTPRCRFDVVSIYPTKDNPTNIEIITDAFVIS